MRSSSDPTPREPAPRRVALRDLQPSQLFVSEEKLRAVTAAGPEGQQPVPVRRYGDRIVLTDGHTRALAAHRAGLEAIEVIEDTDDFDDAAYETCVAWCLAEGVHSVADLDARVVDAATYEELWLERCRAMHRRLRSS